MTSRELGAGDKSEGTPWVGQQGCASAHGKDELPFGALGSLRGSCGEQAFPIGHNGTHNHAAFD